MGRVKRTAGLTLKWNTEFAFQLFDLQGKNIENRQALRLLSFELLPEPILYNHGIYSARYYDYNSNHCITIKGKLGQPNPTEIVESKQQPLPSWPPNLF